MSIKLVTDQEYLPALLELLSKAKKQIDIMSYSFAIGSAAGKHNLKSAPFEIAMKLKKIKKEHGDKLHIRFFTEGLRETVHRNKVTADLLEEAGAEIVYGSTHAKGVCVDNRYVLFGSTNLTNQSIMKNNEANLLIDDAKMAKEFGRYFNHLWNGGEHGGIVLRPPFLADGAFKEVIIDMIEGAKKRIEFSIYFFNQRDIEKALIEAHNRGIEITGYIHQHASFALSYIRANRATVKRLEAAGITDLHWGPPYTFSHSKYIIVDRKEIALGTGNWLDEDVWIHPQLYINLESPALARGLAKHLHSYITSSSPTAHKQK
ncbi:phospholipase D-like domain-containing protein [Peredibacter sp. HCB2-198]|uniref:phospholipase D-like domain-containing protein n=1 Tax=Peredibacter sp. HCB2-198 TaxID=3383025 RepID=UPI0038B5A458